MSYYYTIQCGGYFSGSSSNGNTDCYENVNDVDNIEGDQGVISGAIDEIIKRYGQPIAYYVNTYNTLSANNLYGEDPTSRFANPVDIIMYIELTESTVPLARYGFDPADEITAYVHLSTFRTTFESLSIYSALQNQAIEPKAGDVFQMTNYGRTRPGDRNGKFFEVTERVDQDIGANMNPLGGHYMWRLRAKRLDYSFEPGLSGEAGKNQVYENAFFGRLSGGENPVTDSKDRQLSGWDIDQFSPDVVYDQRDGSGIYGDYNP